MPALFLSSRKRTPEMMKSHWPLNLVFFFIIFIILLFVTMAEFLSVSVSFFFSLFFFKDTSGYTSKHYLNFMLARKWQRHQNNSVAKHLTNSFFAFPVCICSWAGSR